MYCHKQYAYFFIITCKLRHQHLLGITAATWVDLEIINLSEVSLTEKVRNHR